MLLHTTVRYNHTQAWTYYEQRGSTGDFSSNDAAKWNEAVKSKAKGGKDAKKEK